MYGVAEDDTRLDIIEGQGEIEDIDAIINSLRSDRVVLLRPVSPDHADRILGLVAGNLGLSEGLEIQAGLARIRGHRERRSKHFMTVNARTDYQFVPSHSEGAAYSNIQIAAFYCNENSTDGGVTILQNVDRNGTGWAQLKETATKVDLCDKELTARESAYLKMLHGVVLPRDLLTGDEQIVREVPLSLEGIKAYVVLQTPERTKSTILDTAVPVLWDNVAAPDSAVSKEYVRLLRHCGLLKEPVGLRDAADLDILLPRKVWNSGVKYEQLFKAWISFKLERGDLLIQNNLSWTHSCSNWTPNSGVRKIVAAFA